jgi:hypothetical protein
MLTPGIAAGTGGRGRVAGGAAVGCDRGVAVGAPRINTPAVAVTTADCGLGVALGSIVGDADAVAVAVGSALGVALGSARAVAGTVGVGDIVAT